MVAGARRVSPIIAPWVVLLLPVCSPLPPSATRALAARKAVGPSAQVTTGASSRRKTLGRARRCSNLLPQPPL
eukprot:2583547-Pyramimonas_sp.AAC.1